MDELLDELVRASADEDTIHQAVRYYLAERLDDRPPSEMREELDQAFTDPAAVAGMLTELERNPRMLENAALIVLSQAWAEGDRESIRSALADAKGKMPIIEVGLVSLVAMYGLYLWRTKGKKRSELVVSRAADGSLHVREVVEYASPGEPLSAIVRLLGQTHVDAPELDPAGVLEAEPPP